MTTNAGETRDLEKTTPAMRNAEETKDAETKAHSTKSTKRKGTEAPAKRKVVADVTEETTEGEGARGDVPGYVATPEDLCLWEVYGDWVHGNPGTHLDGGVKEDGLWQGWWRDLAVMP